MWLSKYKSHAIILTYNRYNSIISVSYVCNKCNITSVSYFLRNKKTGHITFLRKTNDQQHSICDEKLYCHTLMTNGALNAASMNHHNITKDVCQ